MLTSDQVIIFDCDGVLVNSEVIYRAVEMEHLARIGLVYEPVAYSVRFTGLHGRDFMAALRADHAKLDRGPFPEDFQDNMVRDMYARMETQLTAVEGVHELLERHCGQRAVASSSALKGLVRKLEITDLGHRFDGHIYSGDQVDNGKPAPDLFLMAADKLDAAPTECLVLEDSVNGVKAGIAAGMTVWGFTGAGHADDGLGNRLRSAGAHHVVSSFAEMTAML